MIPDERAHGPLIQRIAGSDGVQAALIDGVWERRVDRVIEGTSFLRCKLQIEGAARYTFSDGSSCSTAGSMMVFLYQPAGYLKHESISSGIRERSVTLVLPVHHDRIVSHGREDAVVSRAIDSLADNLHLRQARLPPFAYRLVETLLGADPASRHYDKMRRAKVDEAACLILDAFLEWFDAPHAGELTARETRQIREARAVLLADIAAPPALPQLAANVGLNRTSLNRGFKTLFGTTPFQLLTRRRMEVARGLIETTDRPIRHIAEGCGYGHLSNFSLAFRAFYGFSPSDLRRGDGTERARRAA